MKFSQINDGYLEGRMLRTGTHCGICGEPTCGFQLLDFKTPDGFPGGSVSLLWKMVANGSDIVGIGCGCYGKVHRQITHIRYARGGKQ